MQHWTEIVKRCRDDKNEIPERIVGHPLGPIFKHRHITRFSASPNILLNSHILCKKQPRNMTSGI
jgi:hypothetical protein